MDDNRFVKDFLAVFSKFNYRYSKWEVWNDFLYLAAVSMANLVPTPDREEREQRYLSIINKYPAELRDSFPELLALVTLALDANPEQDFLGSMYHRLQLHQEQKGQFFTPYHISHFMAEINMVGVDDELHRKGYISVSDPACGAGAMLIAFANVAKAHGINYQKEVLFFGQDIDLTAALMCYVQLSILGCPAIVIVGDSLVKPDFHPDNEIWYTPFYYLHHGRFQSFFGEKEDTDGADVIVEKLDVEKFAEGAGGQLMLNFQNAS